jgi:hypothetical protein
LFSFHNHRIGTRWCFLEWLRKFFTLHSFDRAQRRIGGWRLRELGPKPFGSSVLAVCTGHNINTLHLFTKLEVIQTSGIMAFPNVAGQLLKSGEPITLKGHLFLKLVASC